MKSVGEILKELGFNKEASLETQKAFFKHLAQTTDTKVLKSSVKKKTEVTLGQMEFNLEMSADDKKRVS